MGGEFRTPAVSDRTPANADSATPCFLIWRLRHIAWLFQLFLLIFVRQERKQREMRDFIFISFFNLWKFHTYTQYILVTFCPSSNLWLL